jgi:hypothetical protein
MALRKSPHPELGAKRHVEGRTMLIQPRPKRFTVSQDEVLLFAGRSGRSSPRDDHTDVCDAAASSSRVDLALPDGARDCRSSRSVRQKAEPPLRAKAPSGVVWTW